MCDRMGPDSQGKRFNPLFLNEKTAFGVDIVLKGYVRPMVRVDNCK